MRLLVVYPDTFPYTRFEVFAPDLTLPRHQHPFGKNLCVFPRGSEYWNAWAPGFRAAEVISDIVPNLIRTGGEADPGGEVAQGEPFSDYYSYWPTGSILVPSAALEMAASCLSGAFKVRLRAGSGWLDSMIASESPSPPEIGQALLLSVRDQDDREVAIADPALERFFDGATWSGRWCRLASPVSTTDYNEFLKSIIKSHPWLGKRLDFRNAGYRTHYEFIGVVFPEEVGAGRLEDAWVFLAIGRRGRTSRDKPRPTLLRGVRCTTADCAARIPELSPLRSKAVALIGLGALGSAISMEFCRALLGTLKLMDRDWVDAGTIVRWSGGLEAAGTRKVLAIERLLGSTWPDTRCELFDHQVGVASPDRGSEAETAVLERWLQGADLMIDATAEDNASYVVARCAEAARTPQVYVWSVEGYGGIVARVLPHRTGCYHCLQQALSSRQIEPPEPPTDAERRRVQPRGCGDITFSAANIDLLPLAIEAVRMAFGILCRGQKNSYPDYESDVLVLRLRRDSGELYEAPHWTGHKLPPAVGCPLCASRSRQ